MLVDDILDAEKMKLSFSDFGQTADQIRRAQKFVLDCDFAELVDEMGKDKPTLSRLLPFARIPFAECWIEVAQQHRPSFGMGVTHPQDHPVKRVGYFLRSQNTENTVWIASLFWSFAAPLHQHATGSLMSVLFDVVGESAYAEGVKRGLDYDNAPELKIIPKNLLRSTCPVESPFGVEHVNRAGKDRLDRLAEMALSDWRGETHYLEAALVLLNTKNVAETSFVDQTHQNQRRAKVGLPPRNSFHICKINRETLPLALSHGGEAQMRAHFVRGHFKIRKTGVFWWSPYVRGDLKLGFVDKEYKVEA